MPCSASPPSVFATLPPELIIQILADDELADCDRAALSRTCRLFHVISNPRLYAQNVRHARASCLFWAARHGRLDTLTRALAAGALVNSSESWDDNNAHDNAGGGSITTPLHVAAKYGQTAAAKWLLDHGATVDAASYRFCDALVVYWRQYFTPSWRPGWTPLFAALNHHHAATAELLVAHKARRTNMPTRRRQLVVPALHVAAANGMPSVVEMLAADHKKNNGDIDESDGFDVNARDFSGNTALHYASQYWPSSSSSPSSSSTIPLLLRLGAEREAVNNRLQNPLIHACWSGNWAVATQLVRAGANPKAECYVREVQKLVRPLYLASLSRADIARQAAGRAPPSPHDEDDDCWEAARAEFLAALVAAGVNVNDRLTYSRSFDIPMLQRVCLDNNYAAARTLLQVAGAHVDATDGQGQTALLGYLRYATDRAHHSSSSNNVVAAATDLLALLLASGARLDVRDHNGCDALQQALDWARVGADVIGSLELMLQRAGAANVSVARIEEAIASCYAPKTPGVVVDLLVDFRHKVWGREGECAMALEWAHQIGNIKKEK